MDNRVFISAIARSLQAAEPDAAVIVDGLSHLLGRPWRWLGPLAERYLKEFRGGTCPRHQDVCRFLATDEKFQRACVRHRERLRIVHWLTEAPHVRPAAVAESWDLPVIETAAALAEMLAMSLGDLAWFSDLKTLAGQETNEKLRHYRYRLVGKEGGSVRLIEAPKARLKEAQTRLLKNILDRIPVHAAVHGFVKGRSIKTFTAPHAGRRVVLKMDLRNFFPSVAAARIRGLFRILGYPEGVANLLSGLSTTVAPADITRQLKDAGHLYAQPHLPQGAPTSPALANLCAYRLDCRLAGYARAAGADYTRYADDLAFSGGREFERRADCFAAHIAVIAQDEGFQVHHRKTRVMRAGVRQHLAGLTLNQQANVTRADFDRLKATLTNCLRNGPAGQNRENHPAFRAHLEGKVAFVAMIHPEKGEKLRRLFERILWE